MQEVERTSRIIEMAYPEPIPVIRGKDAEEFLDRLSKFGLSPAQKRFYRGARKFYERKRPKAR